MDLLNEGDKPSQQAPKTAATDFGQTPETDTSARVEALISELRSSGRDITSDYNDWLKVGFTMRKQKSSLPLPAPAGPGTNRYIFG